MSQQVRISNLNAAEDWVTLYKAFTNVNFQAYDFDSIRSSLRDYILKNYPEKYNDWTTNSELVIMMDLLASYGQALGFRTDLNSRDNFMDTAERRSSIFKLARMINYTAKRNYPARGLLKLIAISTNEPVVDSNGVSLANNTIEWNSTTNANWFEQFILILNSALSSTNPFGQPVKKGSVGDIPTQLYQLNNIARKSIVERFSANISGQNMGFELVNPDFEDLGSFSERTPDPDAAKYIIYRNDGTGNASADSGFFGYFKQGTLAYTDFNFSFPEENKIVDISDANVNELDVWVQRISDVGAVIEEWTKVPTTESISYTSLNKQIRNIFSIITRDSANSDYVSVKFGDGIFGNIPAGIFRVWYRVSNGLRYDIIQTDMQNVTASIPYAKNSNNNSQEFNLTLTYGLQYTVDNSVPRETSEDIKQRASSYFYAKTRMINGEDYNVYPLTYQGSNVRKIKAINRNYSGNSRYIDINDPTGSYQNTNVFADDGALYRDYVDDVSTESLPSSKSNVQIIEDNILPFLANKSLVNFFYDKYPRLTPSGFFGGFLKWANTSSELFSSQGNFYDESGSVRIGDYAINDANNAKYLVEGALIQFEDSEGNLTWATIMDVVGDGTSPSSAGVGPVVLNQDIENNSSVVQFIPAFRTTLTSAEVADIAEQMAASNTFGIRYDYTLREWIIITADNLNTGAFSLVNAGSETGTNLDSSWLILVTFSSTVYTFTLRTLEYIYESERAVRFYFVSRYKSVDLATGRVNIDFVKLLKINSKAPPSNEALGIDYSWSLIEPVVYADGYIEPRRVLVTMPDSDSDGTPDNPVLFEDIVDPNCEIPDSSEKDRLVFHKRYESTEGYTYYALDLEVRAFNSPTDFNAALNWEVGEIAYIVTQDAFFECTDTSPLTFEEVTDETLYTVNVGRTDLIFQWRHFAPTDQRIDPAITNIIDSYVLTDGYYQEVLDWLAKTTRPSFPTPPTNDDLTITFADLNSVKAISDEIIWHPAKYKLLFGDAAQAELKARFKVVKMPGSILSDNEIKLRVINAINSFFDVNNWDFGESFFYTELSTYIHQQLTSAIASIVIVPEATTAKFGTLFEVRANYDELFLSTASVSNVDIVSALTDATMRIGN